MSDEIPPDVMPDMTPRVRPRFRKLAIGAFVLLIPIALFALWDYIEARRLGAAVKALREAKQPLTTPSPSMNSMRPDNASRYYDAASALVDLSDTSEPGGLMQRLDRGEPRSPELLAELRAVLDRNREAEALLHRATELEFYGPISEPNYRWGRLMGLSRLSGLRAIERIASADSEGTAQAILQDLKLVRALSWNDRAHATELLGMWSESAARQAMRALPALIEINPSTATVERLAREVAALDQDDAIERSVILERALLVEMLWNEPHQWYARPWRNTIAQPYWQLIRPGLANRAVTAIDLLNDYQNLARRPWPHRLVAEVPLPAPRPRFVSGLYALYSSEAIRYQHARRVSTIAQRLALTRSASVLLAIERYRRVHDGRSPESLSALVPEYLPSVPIDPYSGQELRYRSEPDRVAVYSVGGNRKDDGGEKLGEGPSRRWGIYREDQPPPDIGLAMRLSGGSD